MVILKLMIQARLAKFIVQFSHTLHPLYHVLSRLQQEDVRTNRQQPTPLRLSSETTKGELASLPYLLNRGR